MDKTLPLGIVLATLSDAQALIPTLVPSVGQVDRVKRGDFITLMLKFAPPPVTYVDKEGIQRTAPADPNAPKFKTENLTCIVSGVASNGLISCRVQSHPAYTAVHTVKYGDDFSVYPQYVIVHEPAMPGDASKTGHLLEDLQPIPPIVGKSYWTRDGATASVWTAMQAGQEDYLLGEVSWPSGVGREGIRNVEWLPDGRNRQGNRDLDIVRDPTVKMVDEFPQQFAQK